MANDNWVDSTTYSRDDKVRRQTGWGLKMPSYRITITRGHRDYPNQFVMHCYAAGIDTLLLNGIGVEDVDAAKEKALAIVRMRFNKYLMELNTFSQPSPPKE